MTNKGIEALLNISPFRGRDFSWDMTLNYTRIRNKVTKINGGTQQLSIGQTWAFVGQPYGVFTMSVMCGTRAPTRSWWIMPVCHSPAPATRSSATCRQITWPASTIPLRTRISRLAFSSTSAREVISLTPMTVMATSMELEGDGEPAGPCCQGLVQGSLQPNTKVVHAEDYYQRLNLNYESVIQDGTYLKLRTASIGYKLPAKILGKSPLSTASLTLSGRNLFIYKPHFTGSDPEVSSYGTGNGSQGVYGNTVPTTRSFNLTLNIGFNKKKYHEKNILLIGGVVFLAGTGCKKFVDVNNDPNHPLAVQEKILLAPIEFNIAHGIDAGGARHSTVKEM